MFQKVKALRTHSIRSDFVNSKSYHAQLKLTFCCISLHSSLFYTLGPFICIAIILSEIQLRLHFFLAFNIFYALLMCFYNLHFNGYTSYQVLVNKEIFTNKNLSIPGTYGICKVAFCILSTIWPSSTDGIGERRERLPGVARGPGFMTFFPIRSPWERRRVQGPAQRGASTEMAWDRW